MTSTSGSDCSSVTPAGLTPKLPVTVDTKGRVRTTKEQRRVILAEFERSGLSATQFAQRSGLKYSTFAGWLSRYRRRKRPGLKSVGSGSGPSTTEGTTTGNTHERTDTNNTSDDQRLFE